MMYIKRYRIQRHRRKRLELRRNMDWSEVSVVFDGVELARTSRAELHEGLNIALPDYSLLRIWIETAPGGGFLLYLTRNGHPLPGSGGDPALTILMTVSIFWCMAAVQILLAGAVIRYGNPDRTVYAIGAAGFVLALLGILAWRRSYPAMVLASILCFGEFAMLIFSQGRIDVWNGWRVILGFGSLVWLTVTRGAAG